MFRKFSLVFFLLLIFGNLSNMPSKARITGKGLAITGVALGGTALGVAAYDHFHRRNADYYPRRNNNYNSRPCRSNANYYDYDEGYYNRDYSNRRYY